MPGIATTQNYVLTAMQSGKPISLDDLDTKLQEIERKYIVKACTSLIYAGFVERSERGVFCITQKGLDQLASGEPIKSGKTGRRPGAKRSVKGSLRQRVWSAMRTFSAGGQSRAFSVPDLMTLALYEGEEKSATAQTVGQYVNLLKKTGYLLTLTRRQPGTRPGSNGFKLYKLIRDTGEKSPRVHMREHEVRDGNTKEVFSW